MGGICDAVEDCEAVAVLAVPCRSGGVEVGAYGVVPEVCIDSVRDGLGAVGPAGGGVGVVVCCCDGGGVAEGMDIEGVVVGD